MARKSKKSVTAPEINFYQDFLPMKELKGVELYKQWRDCVFNMILRIVQTQDQEKGKALSDTSNNLYGGIDFFIETGFFHDAYKHNVTMSLEIFSAYPQNPEKIKELLQLIDAYIIPSTKKTQDFTNGFNKGLAGLLAYLLIKFSKCSEHLAIHISKEAYGIASDQPVFNSLSKIKLYAPEPSKIPLMAKLALFVNLFEKQMDWQSLRPRAKHTKSKNDLENGLKCLENVREIIAKQELGKAQKALKEKPEYFYDYISDEFREKILNFDKNRPLVDDETLCAILFASFFENDLTKFALPPQENLA